MVKTTLTALNFKHVKSESLSEILKTQSVYVYLAFPKPAVKWISYVTLRGLQIFSSLVKIHYCKK